MGAGDFSLFWKLSSQMILWIVVGNLLAVPAIFFLADAWVGSFVYSITLQHLLWVIPCSLIVSLLIAFGSVIHQLWRTMKTSPVTYLRSE